MTMYLKDSLQQGITSFKAGDKQQAAVLFHQALQLDPNSQLAWLWLAACVEGEEKRQHLERVVQIHSTSDLAKQARQALDVLARQKTAPPPAPEPLADPPASTEPPNKRGCLRCGKEIGIFDLLGYNKQTGRCGRCEKEAQQALRSFREAFTAFCRTSMLTDADWQTLQHGADRDRIPLEEALAYVRADALNLLERSLSFAFADGLLEEEEEAGIRRLQQMLLLPDDIARPVLLRLEYLKAITHIRRGQLPTVRPSVHLDTGEHCHLEIPATYRKTTRRGVSPIPGRLIGTNRQLHFLSDAGGWKIRLRNIMQVEYAAGMINLELTAQRGNGAYDVDDPLRTWAIIDTLVKLEKRQMLAPQAGQNSRHIPHDVKNAVWQRDGGKCVECAATDYLEFDHIIPYSKGGANTVNNVQLLCRRCNLAKGDRI